MKKIIFTDLDGSLLDHHDYSYTPALPAIKALNAQAIPWLLTTSKTAAEVIDLKAELANSYPFIVENGAGIFWNKGSLNKDLLKRNSVIDNPVIQSWGDDFEYMSLSPVLLPQILQISQNYKTQHQLSFIGFSEMSAEQVVEFTGLPLNSAVKAKQRNFSEPLLWQDSEQALTEFSQAMSQRGLQVIKGGRFVHLMGLSNKGLALKCLTNYYHQAWQDQVQTMALGDGNNDVPLLEASDYPVIICSPVNPPPKVNHPKVVTTKAFGPEGWNQAVLSWLEA
ncbi:mannosyl-3-phosphoglycerate phosphatase [Thiomicrorhabdus sp. Milos-T2]|uniref:HAD-IIB family hydrolase n=1 Tax=Thiomicrorhabdus sp. Milos-T2 TaxID=90814 RepID=UPI000494772A|nr:HAD-IIB family hydrolase [Thiomicrorhabdus sp. Milos-T2]